MHWHVQRATEMNILVPSFSGRVLFGTWREETVAVPLSTVALDALDAHVAYFRALTQRGGGTVVDHGGIVSWHSVHPMGFLVNAVFRVDPRSMPPRSSARPIGGS